MINSKHKFSLLIILILGINSVFAQELRGTITGKITDNSGSVANATITLKPDAKTGYSRYQGKTTTASDGTFTFNSIAFGVYGLKIENKCVTERKDGIEINSDKTVNIEIKIGSEDCAQKEALETAKWKTCEENISQNNIELTDSDKSEIFRELLKNDDEEYKIPDYNILANQPAGIVMSAEDTDKNWLKQITNPRMTILNPTEIKAFAKKRKEDILVLSFSSKAVGNCVEANIGTGWVIGKKSKYIYLSGGGCSYIFRKEAGKWISKQESCTIS
jgi:hypothetical protein